MKHLLLAVTFLTSVSASAQPDTRAKAVLDALSKKASTYKSLKATFTMNIADASGKGGTTQRGTFLMKGPKYRLTLPTQDTRSDGRTLWTYLKEAGEVQVSTLDASSESALSPVKLFTQFSDLDYKSRYLGERKVGAKTTHVIELLPTKSTQAFKKVELAVDKASGTVASGTIWDKSGARYAYTIATYTPNVAIPDEQFVWDAKANAGVELVDLR